MNLYNKILIFMTFCLLAVAINLRVNLMLLLVSISVAALLGLCFMLIVFKAHKTK